MVAPVFPPQISSNLLVTLVGDERREKREREREKERERARAREREREKREKREVT